jgi:CRP/FNR family transcriptional regulator, cyclic AMP receptor protein
VHGSDFWQLLDSSDRDALRAAARERVFGPGTTLCAEGEPSTHVFVLLSGWVKVTTVTRDGQEMLEALRSGGDVVGEISGQVTGYRTATIRAIGTVRALIIGARQFGDFLDAHVSAAGAHRRAMTERQRSAYEVHRNHVLASGPQRLACLLLDLATRQTGSAGDAISAPLPLSQEEIASLIGASRSTVTRALRDWRSRRIINTDQRHITILDQPRLLRIAGRSQ